MKLSVHARRKVVLATAVLALIATPGFAFGFIVFDPSVYAQAVAEVKQAIQMVSTAKLSLSTGTHRLKVVSQAGVAREVDVEIIAGDTRVQAFQL